MQEGIRQIFEGFDDELCNINQTGYVPVRFKPITVNIKVKPPGSGKNNAIVQLAIWVAAQFNRLNKLCRGSNDTNTFGIYRRPRLEGFYYVSKTNRRTCKSSFRPQLLYITEAD